MSWQQLEDSSPELAGFGIARLTKRIAYLATIRLDGSPRVHPVSPFIGHGRLFVYMEPTSPKGNDLRRDPRYAMHCAVEDETGGGGEFCVRGTATVVDDPETRKKAFDAARAIGYKPNDRYILFELNIEEALATTYDDELPFRKKWKSVTGSQVSSEFKL